MIPIAGSALPESPAALQAAVTEGFLRYAIVPREITVEGDNTASLSRISLDLSGANLTRETQIPQPGSPGAEVTVVKALSLSATPLLLEGIPAVISLRAADAGFGLTSGDQLFLVPQRAQDGHLEIEVQRTDLEALIQKVASEAAGKQGVEIKETHLEITSRDERSLSFKADVVGKVFMMKAPVTLTGDLAIDDNLDLHISNLAIGGSGMIANLANSFAQPHLKRAQAQPISLAVFRLGSLQLRDVQLAGGQSLRLTARFGC